MNHILYHKVDLDGHCSGFLVNDHLQTVDGINEEQINMRGINYGYRMDWSEFKKGDKVWIVDFSLTQYDMGRLCGIVGMENVLWFDHHIANYTKMYAADPELKNIPGVRDNDNAGCELVFDHFYKKDSPDYKRHEIVHRIGRYDGWWWADMGDEGLEICDFQLGMELFKSDPKDPDTVKWWQDIMNQNDFVAKTTRDGQIVNTYRELGYSKIDRPRCMDINIVVGDKNYKVGAINSSHSGSHLFGDKLLDKYDAVATWRYNGWGKYRVSFYSNKGNAEPIASHFGGGGHANAAGAFFTTFKDFNKVFKLP